ncbi:MAG: hypothetical protein EB060_07005 [Proteobacteria bacterium]|nr:hypothetical protein [Pseudomonadota bacterium]
MKYILLAILFFSAPAFATTLDVSTDKTVKEAPKKAPPKKTDGKKATPKKPAVKKEAIDSDEGERVRIDTDSLGAEVRHDEIIDSEDGEDIHLHIDSGL